MIQITIQVNAPPGKAIGIKEDLAMYCERYGDTKVVKVEEILPEQMQMMPEGGMKIGRRKNA